MRWKIKVRGGYFLKGMLLQGLILLLKFNLNALKTVTCLTLQSARTGKINFIFK